MEQKQHREDLLRVMRGIRHPELKDWGKFQIGHVKPVFEMIARDATLEKLDWKFGSGVTTMNMPFIKFIWAGRSQSVGYNYGLRISHQDSTALVELYISTEKHNITRSARVLAYRFPLEIDQSPTILLAKTYAAFGYALAYNPHLAKNLHWFERGKLH